jgi:two-component system sensor histidine kinase YesM
MFLIHYAYNKQEYISIQDEWNMLERYIFVMTVRYEQLKVELDYDDRVMKYKMPRMLLQPLIENAIMHGFSELTSKAEIVVECELHGGAVVFTVSDNGGGMDEKTLGELRGKLSDDPAPIQGYSNIALLNIKDRLFHYYGDEGQIQIHSVQGEGTRVSISIPPIEGDSE